MPACRGSGFWQGDHGGPGHTALKTKAEGAPLTLAPESRNLRFQETRSLRCPCFLAIAATTKLPTGLFNRYTGPKSNMGPGTGKHTVSWSSFLSMCSKKPRHCLSQGLTTPSSISLPAQTDVKLLQRFISYSSDLKSSQSEKTRKSKKMNTS